MTEFQKNSKVIIPVVAVVAAALVGLIAFSPSSALAQQSNSTQTAKPTITGTINVPQLIQSQVKVSFSDAANKAASAVNGTVVAGHLGVTQGYLVYTFTVTSGNQMYKVIVDAGSGSVLYQSQGHAIMGHSFGMGAMKLHRGNMAKWQGQSQTPAPQSQSSTSSPGWVQTQE